MKTMITKKQFNSESFACPSRIFAGKGEVSLDPKNVKECLLILFLVSLAMGIFVLCFSLVSFLGPVS